MSWFEWVIVSHSNPTERSKEMMSLEYQVYDCEVLIARAERMGNYDAVRRLTEYENTLRQQYRPSQSQNQQAS
ncbi:hypothetical protein B2J88_22965 [Rhodococcus sp. SRB_17]|nr:hypothetical protein [Rhodococcus sp. SRB_17]